MTTQETIAHLQSQLDECRKERDERIRERDASDLSRASIADFVNIYARECESKEAPDSCASCVKDAVEAIVFRLRTQLAECRKERQARELAEARAKHGNDAGLILVLHGELNDLRQELSEKVGYWTQRANTAESSTAFLKADRRRLDHLEAKRVKGISTEWHIGLAYMGDLRTAIDKASASKEGRL
jgi:hypothetical protein